MIIYDLFCEYCDSEFRLYLDPHVEPKYCPSCGNDIELDSESKQETAIDESDEDFEMLDLDEEDYKDSFH